MKTKILLLTVSTLYSLLSYATSYTWVGGVNSTWSNSLNWTPSGIPGAGDNVTIVSGTNQPTYNGVAGVTNLTMTSGTLNLGGYTLNVSGTGAFNGGTVTNGKLNISTAGNITLAGTTFNCKITGSGANIYLDGSVFNDSTKFTKTGSSGSGGKGNNVFNAYTEIKNTGTGALYLGHVSPYKPDTANATIIFNQENSGHIIIASNSAGSMVFNNKVILNKKSGSSSGDLVAGYNGIVEFNDTIEISNVSTRNLYLGYLSTSQAILQNNATIVVGSSGFTGGTLYLKYFNKQNSNKALNLSFGTSASISIGPSSTINGAVTYTGGGFYLNGCTYNQAVSFTKNGGTANYSSGGNVFNSTASFTNAGSAAIMLANSSTGDDFNGDVTVTKNANHSTYIAHGGISTFAGNITYAGTYTGIWMGQSTGLAGLAILDGTGNQTFTSRAGDYARKLKINKTSGELILNGELIIADSLILANGIMNTSGSSMLVFANGSKVGGASDASHVAGKVKKIGNVAFTFPVGKNGHYRQIGISAPAVTTDAYTAEFFNKTSNDLYTHSSKDGSIAAMSRSEYWKLDRNTGTSNVSVTMSWDTVTTSCSFASAANLRVASWNGTQWKDKGNGGTTGNLAAGTVVTNGTSTTYGAYTLVTTASFNCKPGVSCADVIALNTGDTCLTNVHMVGEEMWFSFVADSANMKISVEKSSLLSNDLIIEIYINCGASISAFDTLDIDDNSIEMDLYNLTINEIYYIKFKTADHNSNINLCIEKALDFTGCYLREACGLDYVQNSIPLNQRTQGITEEGETLPVTINITGIPVDAMIDRAFIWVTGIGSHDPTNNNPDPAINFSLKNTNGFTNYLQAGLLRSTKNVDAICWESGDNFDDKNTFTYYKDVTTAMSSLPNNYNGDYVFGYNGLIERQFDFNGVTLMIVYTSCNDQAARTKLAILHGLKVHGGSSQFESSVSFFTFAQNTNSKGFMIISDLQNNNTSFSVRNQSFQGISGDMYNFVEQSIASLSSPPNFVEFDVDPDGDDCYAVSVMGVKNSNTQNQCTVFSVNAGNDATICKGDNTQLSPTPSGGVGGTPTYSWSPITGLSNPNIANPLASPSQTTTYTVTATNVQGCTATDQVTVTVLEGPPTPIIDGDIFECTTNLTYTVSNPDPYATYSWSAVSGTTTFTPSTGTTSVLTLDGHGGTFNVTATDTRTSCQSVGTFTYYPCCDPAGYLDFTGRNASYIINSSPFSSHVNTTGIPTFHHTNNDPIIINGTFEVNVNFKFSDQEILFGPDAKIIVTNDADLYIEEGSYLHTCAQVYMWDGIYVDDPDEFLYIGASTLEEAKNAVVSDNGADYEIVLSTFNENYKSIVVTDYAQNHPGTIIGSTIECEDDLIPPYDGQRSNIGIDVYNVTGNLVIGDPAYLANANTFDNQNTGIKVSRSEVEIYNNVFQNMPIATGQSTKAGVWVYGNPGVGANNVVTIGGTASYKKNTFNNVFRGVLMEQMASGDVINNDFNNNAQAIYVYRCYNQNTINIENNDITNSAAGIICYRNIQAIVNIENNDIHDMKSWSSGIVLRELTPHHNSARYTVYNNNVTEVRRGIQGLNLFRPFIDDNTVEYKPSNNSYLISRGIELSKNYGAIVTDNNVKSVPTTSDVHFGGIYASMCENAYFSCNTSHEGGYSMQCNGYMECDIFNNSFNNYTRGFWLNNYGVVGAQDNPFETDLQYPSYNHWDNEGNDVDDAYTSWNTDGTLSPFYLRNNPTDQYPLINQREVFPISTLLTLNITNTGGTTGPVCTSIIGHRLLKSAHEVAEKSMNFLYNEINMTWLSQQALYNNLLFDSIDVSNDTILGNFIDSVETAPLGELTQMGFYLEDPSEWKQAQQWNPNMVYVNYIELNHKAIYDIFNEEFEGTEELLTNENTINELRELALKCPFTEGAAVYQARAMLTPYDSIGTVYLNECEIEQDPANKWDEEEEETIPEEIQTIAEERYFRLYPNPNNGEMQLDYRLFEGENGMFTMFDMSGRIIRTHMLNTENGTLRIQEHELGSSLYFYRITIKETTVVTDKILIIK